MTASDSFPTVMSETNLNWSEKHFECLAFTSDVCSTIAYSECDNNILIELVESKCCYF